MCIRDRKDTKGNIITNSQQLLKLYEDVYDDRLGQDDIFPDIKDLKDLNNLLFDLRQKLAQSRETPDWTKSQLLKVLISLKNNKARDPHGMIGELFKPSLAGNDLIDSLLIFLNGIKKFKKSFKFLEFANITSIWKKKGERSDLNNERGIFNLVVIRDILDKMLYHNNYDKIDAEMSDSNIGARKI